VDSFNATQLLLVGFATPFLITEGLTETEDTLFVGAEVEVEAVILDGVLTATGIMVTRTTAKAEANKAPEADEQELAAATDTPLVITLTGSDPETCELAFTIVESPTSGALSAVSDAGCVEGDPNTPNTDGATVTYTPDTDFAGEDSFGFLVNDGELDSDPAAVEIEVGS